jgi:cell division protein FtsN
LAAKKNLHPSAAPAVTSAAKQPIPGWVWLAIGLTVGAFIVFLMKLEPVATTSSAPSPSSRSRRKSPRPTRPRHPQQPVKPKYDFYTLLPESEVIVPPEAVPEKTRRCRPCRPPGHPGGSGENRHRPRPGRAAGANAAAGTTGDQAGATTQFFLQAGSFRKQADADKVRAQIILLGQAVKVESGTVKDETWYRVMVGPFSNREQLTVAQKQLAGAGFSNLLLQQRRRQ